MKIFFLHIQFKWKELVAFIIDVIVEMEQLWSVLMKGKELKDKLTWLR